MLVRITNYSSSLNSFPRFFTVCFEAMLKAVIVFFFVYGSLQSNFIVNGQGQNPDLWFFGQLIFWSCLLVF